MTLNAWVNAKAWRWRTVHALVAALLEQGGFGWGVVAYASHEITQALGGDQVLVNGVIEYRWRWTSGNSLDLLAAIAGALVGNLPRVLR